jgi:hypothetical protein
MTQGRKSLRSARVRRETAPGTRATPRFIVRGPAIELKDARELTEVEEQVGIFGGADSTYIAKLMGEAELPETEAAFEQLSWLFLAAGFGTIYPGFQGSTQGVSGSTGIHLLTIPTTTAPQTVSYTIEAGDPEVETEVMTYGVVNKLTLSGNGGEAIKVSATFLGRYVDRTNASGTFSAAGTLTTVERILSNGSVWLSPIDSTFGTNGNVTAGNILGFEIEIEPMWEPKFPVDSGTTYFSTAVLTDVKITGQFTFEHQVSGTWGAAGSAGQVTKFRSQDAQLLRMEFPGGTIPIGTTAENKLFQINLPIKYREVDALSDQNGNSIRTLKFTSRYNELNAAAGRGTVQIIQRGTSVFDGA